MRRTGLLVASALALAMTPASLNASSDMSCAPAWKLASTRLNCAGRAMLVPGNDTRVNMLFLLREQGGAPAVRLTRPEPDWDSRAFGNSFFGWRTLRQTFYPQPEQAGDAAGSDWPGSRCASLSSGTASFTAALAANKGLAASERDALGAARGRLDWSCRYGGGSGEGVPARPDWPAGVSSAAGRDFLSYLHAADAFYAGAWSGARSGFAALASARDPWLAETAAYMQGRVELNAAQDKAFDDYGYYEGLEKIDKAAVARGQAGIDAYLAKYPQGRYAASARGLVRRALWLGGETRALGRIYERLLTTPALQGVTPVDLVQEVDNKLLFARDAHTAVDTPLLLATLDLMAMRAPYDADEAPVPGDPPRLTAAALSAQAPVFAGRAELYDYLRAAQAYYVGAQYRDVLAIIPDDARRSQYAPLAFSRQMLRGMALAALGDRNEGGFWRELITGAEPLHQRPLVELALALNMERGGKLADIFAPGSPVQDTTIRQILLQHSAGPQLLRSAAGDVARPRRERDIALFTLLYKQLSRGGYAAFAADTALVPAGANTDGGLWWFQRQDDIPVGLFTKGRFADGYACPAIRETAQALARAPGDVKARLCLGDFYRLNGFDQFAQLDTPPEKDELGGVAAQFPGAPLARGTIYAAIMDDPRAAADDRAYALYRAINCYAPGGNNACGGKDVDQLQRRAWFQRLRRDYPASPWTRKLRYFW